jgi:hypothetical protein
MAMPRRVRETPADRVIGIFGSSASLSILLNTRISGKSVLGPIDGAHLSKTAKTQTRRGAAQGRFRPEEGVFVKIGGRQGGPKAIPPDRETG